MLVRSQQDLRAVLRLVSDHNKAIWDARGEDLEISSVIRFRGQLFVCLGNRGGAGRTSRFLNHHRPTHMTILWPFAKPEGWNKCEAYVWMATSNVPFLRATSLPEVSSTDAIPGLKPCDPPDSDVRDDILQTLLASLGPGVNISAGFG